MSPGNGTAERVILQILAELVILVVVLISVNLSVLALQKQRGIFLRVTTTPSAGYCQLHLDDFKNDTGPQQKGTT